MAKTKYTGPSTLAQVVTNVQALVNAVKSTVNTVNTLAQTASAEAKYYGTCATAAATVAKVVTCAGFKLATGARIAIKFTYACTSATATLNINSTGAKNVQWIGTTNTSNAWDANEVVLFEYDGTNFNLIKSVRLTLSNITGTLAIAKGGTGATTAAAALTNLGAAAANHTHTAAAIGAAASSHTHGAGDIASGTLPIARGGTGQTTAAGILSTIGAAAAAHTHTLDSLGAAAANHTHTAAAVGAAAASHNHDAGNITTGTLPLARGGTGQTTAAGILSAIGAAAASHTHTAASIGAAASAHNHAASNITSGTLAIARGGTGATSAAAACTALGAARRVLYNVSIPTGSWSAISSGGYSKAVTISGILSTDIPIVGIVLSSDTASAKLQGAAFGCINRITTANNSITLYAYGSAPTTAMSLQLLVLR